MVDLRVRLGVAGHGPWKSAHGVRCNGIGSSTGHRPASHDWKILLVIDRGLGIKTFLGPNMPESWVGCGLLKVGGGWVRARIVTDQVQVLPGRGGDTERLLHEAVGFISIPIRTLVGAVASIIVAASAFRRLSRSRNGRLRTSTATSFPFHFTVR